MEHVGREHAAAAVVDVVGVAVVGRAERDDRPQRGRPERRDLERVEAAPGDAGHADRAGAPGLLREPGDHLERVVLLLSRVLVVEDPVRLAAAAHVDAHGRVAVAGEVRLADGVARGGAVVLAVGEVLEDRRHRIGLGVAWQPDARPEARPVGELDPRVLDLADGPGQLVPADDAAHCGAPRSRGALDPVRRLTPASISRRGGGESLRRRSGRFAGSSHARRYAAHGRMQSTQSSAVTHRTAHGRKPCAAGWCLTR